MNSPPPLHTAADVDQNDEYIQYAVEDAIAVIRLNRPDKLNSLVAGMLDEYARLLRMADADPSVRAIVVTGNGRGFCAGADLSMLHSGPEALRDYIDRQDPDSGPAMTFTLSTPVVTAINGPCAGLGFVIAVCADRRFVHPDATLSTTFSRLGLVAEYGISWVLPRLIGWTHATDLLITGRTITGREAGAMGLAEEAVEPFAAAMEWAHAVSQNCSPASIGHIKRALLTDAGMSLHDCMVETLRVMGDAFEGADLMEALQAREERRLPRFNARTP